MESDPTDAHSDSDGLADDTEVIGWTEPIEGTRRSPDRYDPHSTTRMHVSANPSEADTDDDGLPDDRERAVHTDPRKQITYQVTRDHQEHVIDVYDGSGNSQVGGITNALNATWLQFNFNLNPRASTTIEHPRDLADVTLTDATDDFDYLAASDQRYFSYPDTPHSPLFANQLDVWTPTYLEASMGTDPWQPDTDGDGLTDGHEQFGIPLSRGTSMALYDVHELDLDPTDPDTDDDGAVDGGDFMVVNDWPLGTITVQEGELLNYPSSPEHADVIDVFVAVDQAFLEKHAPQLVDPWSDQIIINPEAPYQSDIRYVEELIAEANAFFADEFSEDEATPYLRVTNHTTWENENVASVRRYDGQADPTDVDLKEMATKVNDKTGWPTEGLQGADVLSAFSGRDSLLEREPKFPFTEKVPVENLPRSAGDGISVEAELDPNRNFGPLVSDVDQEYATTDFDEHHEFAAGTTYMSVEDEHAIWRDEFNSKLYVHEVGHVMGAVHPSLDDLEREGNYTVPDSAGGIMCKSFSCARNDALKFMLDMYPSIDIEFQDYDVTIPVDPTGTVLAVNSVIPTEFFVFESEFSTKNHERMKNAEMDWYDSEGPGRNISTLAKGNHIGNSGQ